MGGGGESEIVKGRKGDEEGRQCRVQPKGEINGGRGTVSRLRLLRNYLILEYLELIEIAVANPVGNS